MNSGINFDIMYELACGRIVGVTDASGHSTYYWVSQSGKLIRSCPSKGLGYVHGIVIPWGREYTFSVKERDFKNSLT